MAKNMACFRPLGLTFIVLMIVGTVKGRWLDLDQYPTSSLISDGIHNNTLGYLRMSGSNSSTLYDEKRCESIYGFLPCADTMAEGVFLMILYTGLMMLGEDLIREGSETLFLLLGDKKMIGATLFRLLMAFPRIVMVIVAGIFSTESAAQSQVAFGVSMYAGSTFITLTFIWGFCIMSNRHKLLQGKLEPKAVDENDEDLSTRRSPLKDKLSFLVDNGVKTDSRTRDTAKIMLSSLIPFLLVELVAFIKTPIMILFTLIVSVISLILYFAYKFKNPWIQDRTLAFLKEEKLRIWFLYNIQRVAEGDLLDNEGNLNTETINRAFTITDEDNDDHIKHDELEKLIGKKIKLDDNDDDGDDVDDVFKEYAKAEIFSHFDEDKSGKINRLEFEKGCTEWLKKCQNDANISSFVFKNLRKQQDNSSGDTKEPTNTTDIEKPINMAGTSKPINNADTKKPVNMAYIMKLVNKVESKAKILYVILGVPMMFLISKAFMESVIQFSNAAHISSQLTSFVVIPIAMSVKMVIKPFFSEEPRVSKNASLIFSEMYDGLVMNNLLGLLTLLAIVYAKGLPWTYVEEVQTIVMPCLVVGVYALKRYTYTLWASISAMLIYPIYICLYYVFGP